MLLIIAYLLDSVVHFLTYMSFLFLHFYSYLLTLLSILCSVVHFRSVSKMEHIFLVPKRLWKWKKYKFIEIFWLFNTDCSPIAWHPLSWGKEKKIKTRTWVSAINPLQRYSFDFCSLTFFFFFFFSVWANIAILLFIAGTDLLLHVETSPVSVLMYPMHWFLSAEHSVLTNGEGQCCVAAVSEQIALGKIPCSS